MRNKNAHLTPKKQDFDVATSVNLLFFFVFQDNWQHSNGRPVSREDLMMTLANLDSINIRTIYDNHMVSVALSDIVMDITSVEFSILGHAKRVEECR